MLLNQCVLVTTGRTALKTSNLIKSYRTVEKRAMKRSPKYMYICNAISRSGHWLEIIGIRIRVQRPKLTICLQNSKAFINNVFK